MTLRAWCRALALAFALLVVWALIAGAVSHRTIVYIEAERKAEAEHDLVMRMLEVGRTAEEILDALKNLNERHKDDGR